MEAPPVLPGPGRAAALAVPSLPRAWVRTALQPAPSPSVQGRGATCRVPGRKQSGPVPQGGSSLRAGGTLGRQGSVFPAAPASVPWRRGEAGVSFGVVPPVVGACLSEKEVFLQVFESEVVEMEERFR